MARPRKDPDSQKAEFISELDEGQREIWEHRFENEAFVRAFAWARGKGNETKACLIYADGHELDHEDSDTPVVNRD